MSRSRIHLAARLALLTVLTSLLVFRPQAAGRADPPPPARQDSLLVHYTAYTWWLLDWQENQVVCSLTVDHDDLPTHPEIRHACGEAIYQDWAGTQPCDASLQDPSACRGIYLHFQGSSTAKRTVIVDLPEPTVHINLIGCQPAPPDFVCQGQPTLLLTGIEPLPNETIVTIRGTLAGLPFTCPADRCELPLRPTSRAGSDLVFWGESSFGDSTEHFTALIRVLPIEETARSEAGTYVDVLSSQWRGTPPASCSVSWDALPPPGGLPDWLTTPTTANQLNSDQPYSLLAGILIAQGLADAGDCPDGGLLSSGAASPCGLQAVRPEVVGWQNRFNELIISTAQAKGVPAQLMKNLFAVESQFWPGIYEDDEEVGFGQLTENGADTALLWNGEFYNQFCPLVLEQGICAKGYPQLLPGEQAMLRGALVLSASAYCPDCPIGIDLSRADFSIEVFAETLLANCEQVGRMVRNTTGEHPGRVADFEDLWRFTVSNYNAGPGCLSNALQTAWRQNGSLTWSTVSEQFLPACTPVIDYVDQVTRPPSGDPIEG